MFSFLKVLINKKLLLTSILNRNQSIQNFFNHKNMRTLLILSGFLLSFAACKSDKNDNFEGFEGLTSLSLASGNLDETILKILEGQIGEEAVEMQLYVEKNKGVRGSYFYKKDIATVFQFKGKLANDGRMLLQVYDVTKEEIENFKGRVSIDWDFVGTWYKVEAGAEKIKFALKPKADDFSAITKIEGTYKFDTTNYHQILCIRNLAGNQFEFQIKIESSSCAGGIETGIAFFQDGKTANYYGEGDCYVNFSLDGTWVKIIEQCAYWHGAQCSFDGSYKKTSNKVEWDNDFYDEEDTGGDDGEFMELGR